MKKTAFIYIILAGVFWGTSGIFFNVLKPYGFTSLDMTVMRDTVAAVLFSIYVFIKDKHLFKVRLKELLLFACSGLSVFGTAYSYFAAIEASSVSTAVVLMYTAPVFVMAFSVAFLGEKLTKLKLLAVVLMIAGCALVSGIVGGMELSFTGVLLGLFSGVVYSAYNIFTKIEMMKGCNSLSATVYCFIFMGLTSLFACDLPEMVLKITLDPVVIIPLILGIGLCTCVLPYFLYTMALKDIPAGTASALSIIEPMSATIFSVTIFGEALTVPSVVGIILVLAAVFLLGREGSESKE